MEGSAGSAAALSAGAIAPESSRGASLAIRLSAVIVTATVGEPRLLTLRIGREPIEALALGPARGRASYIGGRPARLGRAADGPASRLCRAALHLRRPRPRRDRRNDAGPRLDGGLSGAGARGAARPASAEAVWQNWYRFFPWEDWRSGRPAALASVEERLGAMGAAGRERGGAAAARGAGRPRLRRRRGTRSWSSNATNCSTRRA